MSILRLFFVKFREKWMNNTANSFKKFPDMSKSVLRSSKYIGGVKVRPLFDDFRAKQAYCNLLSFP